jgi:chaperone LolA
MRGTGTWDGALRRRAGVLCVVSLAVLITLGGLAESSNAKELDSLITEVQATYERLKALRTDFVQVATLSSIGRQQTSRGRLYIQKPHSIRWEYTEPEAQTILYDGDVLRIYTPKRHQVLQSQITEDQRHNIALLFLAGVGKLQEAFTITSLPSSDAHVRSLRLLPRSRQASFTELHIAVNTQSFFVESLKIYDTIGNVTDIRLASPQVFDELPPQTFELALPPHTEILTPADLSGRQ